jgi:hypothetical protein
MLFNIHFNSLYTIFLKKYYTSWMEWKIFWPKAEVVLNDVLSERGMTLILTTVLCSLVKIKIM